jgi:hypothetical protein
VGWLASRGIRVRNGSRVLHLVCVGWVVVTTHMSISSKQAYRSLGCSRLAHVCYLLHFPRCAFAGIHSQASHLVEPNRPASFEDERYYAASTGVCGTQSRRDSSFCTPGAATDLQSEIIGCVDRWRASNAHMLQSTPQPTALPIAFVPSILPCSCAGQLTQLCRESQLFSGSCSETPQSAHPVALCLFRALPGWGQHYTNNNVAPFHLCTAATASTRYPNPCLSTYQSRSFATRSLPYERLHVIEIADHFAVDIPRMWQISSRCSPRHPEAHRRTTAKPFMQAQLSHFTGTIIAHDNYDASGCC